MDFIGLDLSITSSAMYILKDDGTELYFNYKKSTDLTKWHKKLDFINYRTYTIPKSEKYSDDEILKHLSYKKITDMLLEDIAKYVDPKNTIVSIEGYSYGSRQNTSSIIDLVTYSTLLRDKILSLDFKDFVIKSPTQLKKETAMCTYEPIRKVIHKGKVNERVEYTYKNQFGIAGGSFTKHDMLDAIMDNKKVNIKIKQALLNDHKHLQKMKNIPKPIDDMIDACWLSLVNVVGVIY